jgi:hypothetical protein
VSDSTVDGSGIEESWDVFWIDDIALTPCFAAELLIVRPPEVVSARRRHPGARKIRANEDGPTEVRVCCQAPRFLAAMVGRFIPQVNQPEVSRPACAKKSRKLKKIINHQSLESAAPASQDKT